MGKKGNFECGQSVHMLKDFPSTEKGKGGNNNRAQSTVPAVPTGCPY